MKKILAIVVLLFATFSFGNPSIFQMEIGKTTESEMRSLYESDDIGVNKYTSGNMYSIPPEQIEFDGLKKVTIIFDKEEKLVGVIAIFHKSKFDYLYKILNSKYKLTYEDLPFVGSKIAKFKENDTQIFLEAPHLSFDMIMNYIHDDFEKNFQQQNKAEKQAKTKSEASQL